MSDFLPPRPADRDRPSPKQTEDSYVTAAFNDLEHSRTMFQNSRRFTFRIWHGVVFFAGLAAMPFLIKYAFGG